ncbi:hypothetical protein, partial [Corallococcus praedator]
GLGGHAHVHGSGGHVHREAGEAKAACATPTAVAKRSLSQGPAASQEKPATCAAETGRSDEERQQGHGHRHLTGSVEHLLAVAASWTVFLPPTLRWVSWRVEPARGPEWSPGQRLRSSAMPQGP